MAGSFAEGLDAGIRRAFCQVLAAEAAFEDFFGQNLPLQIRPYYNLGRGAYTLLCNNVPPAQPPPQFPAGRCPVPYSITINYEYRILSANWIPDQRVIPCSDPNSTPRGPFSNFRREVRSDAVAYYVDGFDSIGDPREYQLTDAFGVETSDIRNGTVSYSRCDGLPDDCGTPVPVPPPPGYNNIDIDIDYTNNDGIDVTIPVGITLIRPVFNVDADVVIPIRVELPDVNIDATVNFTAEFNISTGDINFNIGGDFNYNDGGRDDPGGNTPAEEPPDPPPDSGEPDVPVPEDPEKVNKIVGLLCTTTDPGKRPSLIVNPENGPDIWVPAIAWVSFLVRIGEADSGFLKHIPINLLREFIPCPWEEGAIGWATINPNAAAISIVPIYKKFDLKQPIE